jgi:hypothetical protein
MKVGFTGTQIGMTQKQRVELAKLLVDLRELNTISFHHGDCIGADKQAHDIALSLSIPIIIYPPLIDKKRAFCKGYYSRKTPMSYLARNHAIVDDVEILIACPKSDQEEMRSGTWATVRYARKTGKSVTIINP